MCLTVKTNLRRRPVKLMRCRKILKDWSNSTYCMGLLKADEKYVTSVMNSPVPANGFLVPKKPLRMTFRRDDTIEGGVIHAYTNKKRATAESNSQQFYKAYAFDVIAFGSRKDLVARALYIPDADSDPFRRQGIVKMLERALRKGTKVPNWKNLRRRKTCVCT